MLTDVLPKKFLLLGLCLVFVLSLGSYFVLGKQTDNEIKQQLLKSQKVVSRIQAGSIETFFEVFGDSLVVLSTNLNHANSSESIVRDIDIFVDQWRRGELVAGVVITDESGLVTFNSNILGTRDIGVSLSDRDYFEWAKNANSGSGYFVGESVVSKLGASKGQVIVPVATPIFKNEKFDGALVASVKLEFLTQYFLGLTEVSDSSITQLLDPEGNILYKNSEISFDMISEKDYLITKAPVAFENLNWTLVMATPQIESVSFSPPMVVKAMVALLFISITLFIYGSFVVKETGKIQVIN